jgi:hypothetical protein
LDRSSIFHRVTNENEDATTELLCNLLRDKYVRDICLKALGVDADAIEAIKFKHCSTQSRNIQVGGQSIGRPDLVISNDKCFYLIENKIRTTTGLQPKQLENYPLAVQVKRERKTHIGLIFLLPTNYDKTEIEELKKANAFIKIATWDKFLTDVYKSGIDKNAPLVAESLKYLSSLTLRSPIDTTLTPYEVAMLYNPKDICSSLDLITKIQKLIEQTIEPILKELGDKFALSKYQYFLDSSDKGVFINYNDNAAIFIGLNLTLLKNPDAKDVRGNVFGVAILEDIVPKDYNARPFDSADDGGYNWYCFGISAQVICSPNASEEFIKEVCTIIKSVLGLDQANS